MKTSSLLRSEALIFVVVSLSSTMSWAAKVLNLSLVQAGNSAVIQSLNNGSTYYLNQLPTKALSLIANTSPAVVGKVTFILDGGAYTHTENFYPYTLCGKANPNEYTCPQLASVGTHTLKIIPYNTKGKAGTAMSLSFKVVANPPAPVPAPAPSSSSSSSSGGSVTSGSGSSSSSSSGAGTVSGQFGVAVSGNQLISTATGQPVVLRGADVDGLEYVFLSGDASDASSFYGNGTCGQLGTQTPWTQMTNTWKMNAVRLPLEEFSWLKNEGGGSLGANCTDFVNGQSMTIDPDSNYQSVVESVVNSFTANGMYVIIDLHFAAPGNLCTGSQIAMADADHALAFWTSVANKFKNNPAVIFDMFNEPYAANSTDMGSANASDWSCWLNGCQASTIYGWNNGSGSAFSYNYSSLTNGQKSTWNVAGMQQILNAIRATGAKNVVMAGGLAEAVDFSMWLQYKPVDPLHQLAASWHSYNINSAQESDITNILKAGVPVIIGEFSNGDTQNVIDTTNFANNNGVTDISVLAWSYDSYGSCSSANGPLRNSNDVPTAAGSTYLSWLLQQ